MAKKKNDKKTKASSKEKAAKLAVKTKTTKKPTKSKAPAPRMPNGTASKPRNRKAAPARVPQITITLTHDQIAARAYEVWLRNGCVNGRDYENWKQAEAELLAEMHA